jgi:hypothetical protein
VKPWLLGATIGTLLLAELLGRCTRSVIEAVVSLCPGLEHNHADCCIGCGLKKRKPTHWPVSVLLDSLELWYDISTIKLDRSRGSARSLALLLCVGVRIECQVHVALHLSKLLKGASIAGYETVLTWGLCL